MEEHTIHCVVESLVYHQVDKNKEEDKMVKADPWKFGKTNGPASIMARYVLRSEKCKYTITAAERAGNFGAIEG